MQNATVKKCVTIISNNLSGGGALACVSLGRALQSHFDIQLIGSCFGASPWPGLRDVDFEVDILAGPRLPSYLAVFNRGRRKIRGDVVIAHQLRLPSFGLALARRAINGTPFAVYIDDDDLALTIGGRNKRLRDRLRTPSGDLYTRLIYRLRGRADATLCGSDHFSRRFNGTTVPVGRDASLYHPDAVDRAAIRDEFGLSQSATVIGFMGNPRPHVGIEDLVEAVDMLAGEDVVLLVVPPGKLNDFGSSLFAHRKTTVKVLEEQPSAAVPALLGASDVVVVPQRSGQVSMGQLPARLVEAMAMAKPVIATRVGEIPTMLGDCGLYVDDRAPEQIAAAIRRIKANPEEFTAVGRRAREIFLERLSLDAMTERLKPVIDSLLTRRSKQ